MPIRVLPPGLAALIAAGEVIERPAAVVRELLDNAIDAGATRIEVSVRGLKLQDITVSDNGCGMPPEDLAICLDHHTTSKLRGDTLGEIPTLGFRGEALASIASVAAITVASRPPGQDVAFQVAGRPGAASGAVRPVAGGYGTRVTVTDLFFNHPARLKFLKSDRVERAWVSEAVERAALAHPHIEFLFSAGHDRKQFRPGDFGERMKAVLSRDFAADAVKVEHARDDIVVRGIVPLPGAVTPSGGRQVFIVNGRPVGDRMLSGVVSSVYRSLTGTRDTPGACLHISLPFDRVDVNVHPQKSEVRFLDSPAVAAFVREAVETALADAGMRTPAAVFGLARSLADPGGDTAVSDRRRLPLGRLLGQAGSKWLVSETMDGVAIVDQHAAHERVVLERLKASVHGGDEDMVRVSPPVTRDLPAMSAAVLSASLDTLRDLGFSVRLAGDTVAMDGYPSVLSGCVPAELLEHMVGTCLREVAGGVVGEALWETLATAACKAAIKAGDALEPERADRLLREIEATPNAAQCNHGRPTMIFLRHEDIAKLFGR